MTKVPCVCESCGKEFSVFPSQIKKGNVRYCSRQCYLEATTSRVEKICKHCGKTFSIHQSKLAIGLGKYCSHECYSIDKNAHSERKCEYCGKSFMARRSHIERGKAKYCSRECRALARRKRETIICDRCGKTFEAIPSDHRRYCSHECKVADMDRQVECKCRVCSKLFTLAVNLVERGNGKYCSIECYGIGNRGANNVMWRGGKKKYRGPNWYEQRRLAYARDGGKCQRCGKKPRKGERQFQVHHIKPFREFSGDYIAANDLLNLVTLCHQCHPKAEWGLPVPKRLL